MLIFANSNFLKSKLKFIKFVKNFTDLILTVFYDFGQISSSDKLQFDKI